LEIPPVEAVRHNMAQSESALFDFDQTHFGDGGYDCHA
jgi:hypothetical protein